MHLERCWLQRYPHTRAAIVTTKQGSLRTRPHNPSVSATVSSTPPSPITNNRPASVKLPYYCLENTLVDAVVTSRR